MKNMYRFIKIGFICAIMFIVPSIFLTTNFYFGDLYSIFLYKNTEMIFWFVFSFACVCLPSIFLGKIFFQKKHIDLWHLLMQVTLCFIVGTMFISNIVVPFAERERSYAILGVYQKHYEEIASYLASLDELWYKIDRETEKFSSFLDSDRKKIEEDVLYILVKKLVEIDNFKSYSRTYRFYYYLTLGDLLEKLKEELFKLHYKKEKVRQLIGDVVSLNEEWQSELTLLDHDKKYSDFHREDISKKYILILKRVDSFIEKFQQQVSTPKLIKVTGVFEKIFNDSFYISLIALSFVISYLPFLGLVIAKLKFFDINQKTTP